MGNLIPPCTAYHSSHGSEAAAIEFGLANLPISDVIVCGHYGCGGVLAALRDEKFGLIDNWLRHVQDVRDKHRERLDSLGSQQERHDRLCELNVVEQTLNVCRSTPVRDAWARGQSLAVHGWIYNIGDGLLKDLGLCLVGETGIDERYQAAIAGCAT